jgi:hypothetical protein
MSFNPGDNLAYAPSMAYSIGSGPIPVDSSTSNEVLQVYHSNTATNPPSATALGNYNGLEVNFDVRVGSSSRVRFDKSFIKVTGRACNTYASLTEVVSLGCSIPWNTIAALFDSAEVILNQNGSTVEQIVQNLGHASMMKMLTKYNAEALEQMGDMFFTPCIEERRDIVSPCTDPTASGLSVVSRERRNRQLINHVTYVAGSVAPTYKDVSKNVYLCEVFDSLRVPAAFASTNIELKLRTRSADEILIKDPQFYTSTGLTITADKFFITGMDLYLVIENLTADQLKIETEKVLSNETVLRESFTIYDCIVKDYTSGSNIRDSNVKNMQACIVAFPSNLTSETVDLISNVSTTPVGINPFQYTYNFSTVDGQNGISSFQSRYGQFLSPTTSLRISNTMRSTNSDLYQLYRNLSQKLVNRKDPPALSNSHMSTPQFNAVALVANTRDYLIAGAKHNNTFLFDSAPYVLFCAPFFPQTTHPHKIMSGEDHEIFLAGSGNTPSRVAITRIRTGYLQLKADTSLAVFN